MLFTQKRALPVTEASRPSTVGTKGGKVIDICPAALIFVLVRVCDGASEIGAAREVF